MLTTTLQDRLRRASALTGLEPAEMVRCAISEWLQRLEQPPLPFASAAPPKAGLAPVPVYASKEVMEVAVERANRQLADAARANQEESAGVQRSIPDADSPPPPSPAKPKSARKTGRRKSAGTRGEV